MRRGVLAEQDLLESAKQRRIDARLDDAVVSDVQADFEIALDTVERSQHDAPHDCLRHLLEAGLELGRRDDGVVGDGIRPDPLRRGRLRQGCQRHEPGLGHFFGSPIGMPPILGVSANGCPGSSKPGSVQLMQA